MNAAEAAALKQARAVIIDAKALVLNPSWRSAAVIVVIEIDKVLIATSHVPPRPLPSAPIKKNG